MIGLKKHHLTWKDIVKALDPSLYDKREAESIAFILLQDRYGMDKMSCITLQKIPEDESQLSTIIKRLNQQEPVQYITHKAFFYSHYFYIDESVLIPRPETEELVELILNQNTKPNPKILDIGTGSGIIAISLAKALKRSNVIGIDVSKDALSVAKKNAKQHDVKAEWIKCDVLTDHFSTPPLDIIVSNPPYIPIGEIKTMEKNVINFEPHLALFVEDNKPLTFYERISTLGKSLLKKSGRLYFEVHEQYATQVVSLLEALGYHDVQTVKDMQQKDRIVVAKKG